MRIIFINLYFLLAWSVAQNVRDKLNIMTAQEAGILNCTMKVHTSQFPELKRLNYTTTFTLHLLLRYMTNRPGSKKAMLQGVSVVDVQIPNDVQPYQTAVQKISDDPEHIIFQLQLELKDRTGKAWQLRDANAYFPLAAVKQTAFTGSIHSFLIFDPSIHIHEYTLSAIGGTDDQSCQLLPLKVPNRLDPRGIRVSATAVRKNSRDVPDEAVVVIKPLFHVKPETSLLLTRHIEHYTIMGFTRYLLYVRPPDIPRLSLEYWSHQSILCVIKWDVVPPHDGLPLWDQRFAYNHALLALLGKRTWMFVPDLDEYMVPLKSDPSNIFELVRKCTNAKDSFVNLQLVRYNAIAKEWPNRTQGELPLWLDDPKTSEHPLANYHLINRIHFPHFKSMVNPNFINVYYIHGASAYARYNVSRPEPHCLAVLHLCNLLESRDVNAKGLFRSNSSWVSSLQTLMQQHRQWVQRQIQGLKTLEGS